jgi:hypothetical protein
MRKDGAVGRRRAGDTCLTTRSASGRSGPGRSDFNGLSAFFCPTGGRRRQAPAMETSGRPEVGASDAVADHAELGNSYPLPGPPPSALVADWVFGAWRQFQSSGSPVLRRGSVDTSLRLNSRTRLAGWRET